MAKKTALFVVAVLAPATVFAQAWVPRAGDGTVAFVYQNQLVRDHLFSDGARIDAGHIKSNGVLLDFTYGITDRLALNVNVPYTASAYHGSNPHPGSLLDDGKTHGTLQDFRANFRYNLMNKGIVLTPFVDVIVPSHRYDYFGHAAPGRRLAEAQIGTCVGHVLTSGLPARSCRRVCRTAFHSSRRPRAILRSIRSARIRDSRPSCPGSESSNRARLKAAGTPLSLSSPLPTRRETSSTRTRI